MKRLTRTAAVLVLVAGLAGCGDDGSAPGDPIDIGSLIELHAVPGVSVAVIRDFQLDYGGSPHAMSHNLRFFSADGVFEQTVGREGKGPGDFGGRGLESHQGPGDTLLVHDVANARVNTIAPDGTWLGSFSTQAGDHYSDWDDHVAAGRLVSKHSAPTPDTLREALDIVLARDVHGAVLDTVARIPTARSFAREGGLRFYYRGRPDFDLCGDGLVCGRSDEYRIS